MGLVTRISPSHIAQFWRDWNAMLGYRSADQSGGYLRTGLGPAPVAECDPISGLTYRQIADSAR